MSATTLFVGGPMDGDLRVVEDWRLPVFVAEPADLSPASFRASVDEVEPVSIRTTVYRSERLSFFGVPLLVHVHESLVGRTSALRLALGRHLLSDLGKAVVQ